METATEKAALPDAAAAPAAAAKVGSLIVLAIAATLAWLMATHVGIRHCSICDGAFSKTVAIVGGSALTLALLLAITATRRPRALLFAALLLVGTVSAHATLILLRRTEVCLLCASIFVQELLALGLLLGWHRHGAPRRLVRQAALVGCAMLGIGAGAALASYQPPETPPASAAEIAAALPEALPEPSAHIDAHVVVIPGCPRCAYFLEQELPKLRERVPAGVTLTIHERRIGSMIAPAEFPALIITPSGRAEGPADVLHQREGLWTASAMLTTIERVRAALRTGAAGGD